MSIVTVVLIETRAKNLRKKCHSSMFFGVHQKP